MAASAGEPGGFLLPSLPSPPTSAPSVSSTLPKQRSHSLKPNSRKETWFINIVDNQLLEISRRFENRYNARDMEARENTATSVGDGYENFPQASKDLEKIFDLIWVSGTPSLQVPFLLNVADLTSSYIVSFPFSQRRTFQLLQKLDLAFSSLLLEVDAETGDPLPGFETGRKVTMTEKIRLRGIVERTRLNVARVATGDESFDDNSRVSELSEDGEGSAYSNDQDNDESYDESYTAVEMEVARVYQRTLTDLGPVLDSAPDIGLGIQGSG